MEGMRLEMLNSSYCLRILGHGKVTGAMSGQCLDMVHAWDKNV